MSYKETIINIPKTQKYKELIINRFSNESYGAQSQIGPTAFTQRKNF